MVNFYTQSLKMHPAFHDKGRVSDLSTLAHPFRQKILQILADAIEMEKPLMVWETFRSRERQQLLYTRGVTKLKDVGVHTFGLACDLVRDVGGSPSWKGDFSFLGVLAAKHGLVWGGNWKSFPDACHVQWCSVRRQQSLFMGSWYPSDDYNPLKD